MGAGSSKFKTCFWIKGAPFLPIFVDHALCVNWNCFLLETRPSGALEESLFLHATFGRILGEEWSAFVDTRL